MDLEHQGLVADLLGLLAKGADAVDRSDDREHGESCGGCVAIAVVSAERSRAWLPDLVALPGLWRREEGRREWLPIPDRVLSVLGSEVGATTRT